MPKNLLYLGRTLPVSIAKEDRELTIVTLTPHKLVATTPLKAPSAAHLAAEIRLWMKQRARRKLKKRLDLWSERTGLSYTRHGLSDARRQWGSCSAHNVIRLNWRLIMIPLPLIDYVIVHELCHIKHKNHQRDFWKAVGSFMPDYKNRRAVLKKLSAIAFKII